MILDRIIQSTQLRVLEARSKVPLEKLKEMIYDEDGIRSFHMRPGFAFEKALRVDNPSLCFICEVKKASPSKGIISEAFPYLEIALEYEKAGANAISVLTEPDYFMGSNQYLTEISKAVHIPVLRKDFIIDEYQIYEAKVIGADAVLLICSVLDNRSLKRYLSICDELGLSALVEAHDEAEVHNAIEVGARVIGVNNRNLKSFEVNLQNSIQLRRLVPENIIFIAESGIHTPDDIKDLEEAKVNGVLIGEALMKSSNIMEQLNKLRGL